MGIEIVAIIGAGVSIISTLIGAIYAFISKKMKEKGKDGKITIQTKSGTEISVPLDKNEAEIVKLIQTLIEDDSIISIKIKS